MNLKRISIVCAAALLAALLCGCGCQHQWQKSTCQNPRTCTLCGATEGKVRSHEWESTACNDPKGCIVCGTTEGMELTHQWQEDSKICIHCGLDERAAELRFPEMLSAGLEARWALEEEMMARDEDKKYVFTEEDWAALFEAEYSRLASFKDAKFEDENLKKAALSYVGSIEESIAALEFFGSDSWEDKYFNSAYWNQAEALFLLNSLCSIEVSEDYVEKLGEMITNGEIINMVRPLFDQVMFLHIESHGDKKVYETTLKNTTSLEFEWFSFDVNLLDKDGKVADTTNIEVERWKPDEKRRFNFNTDIELGAIKVAFANWQLHQ